jgi:hypothetical protein
MVQARAGGDTTGPMQVQEVSTDSALPRATIVSVTSPGPNGEISTSCSLVCPASMFGESKWKRTTVEPTSIALGSTPAPSMNEAEAAPLAGTATSKRVSAPKVGNDVGSLVRV